MAQEKEAETPATSATDISDKTEENNTQE